MAPCPLPNMICLNPYPFHATSYKVEHLFIGTWYEHDDKIRKEWWKSSKNHPKTYMEDFEEWSHVIGRTSFDTGRSKYMRHFSYPNAFKWKRCLHEDVRWFLLDFIGAVFADLMMVQTKTSSLPIQDWHILVIRS